MASPPRPGLQYLPPLDVEMVSRTPSTHGAGGTELTPLSVAETARKSRAVVEEMKLAGPPSEGEFSSKRLVFASPEKRPVDRLPFFASPPPLRGCIHAPHVKEFNSAGPGLEMHREVSLGRTSLRAGNVECLLLPPRPRVDWKSAPKRLLFSENTNAPSDVTFRLMLDDAIATHTGSVKELYEVVKKILYGQISDHAAARIQMFRSICEVYRGRKCQIFEGDGQKLQTGYAKLEETERLAQLKRKAGESRHPIITSIFELDASHSSLFALLHDNSLIEEEMSCIVDSVLSGASKEAFREKMVLLGAKPTEADRAWGETQKILHGSNEMRYADWVKTIKSKKDPQEIQAELNRDLQAALDESRGKKMVIYKTPPLDKVAAILRESVKSKGLAPHKKVLFDFFTALFEVEFKDKQFSILGIKRPDLLASDTLLNLLYERVREKVNGGQIDSATRSIFGLLGYSKEEATHEMTVIETLSKTESLTPIEASESAGASSLSLVEQLVRKKASESPKDQKEQVESVIRSVRTNFGMIRPGSMLQQDMAQTRALPKETINAGIDAIFDGEMRDYGLLLIELVASLEISPFDATCAFALKAKHLIALQELRLQDPTQVEESELTGAFARVILKQQRKIEQSREAMESKRQMLLELHQVHQSMQRDDYTDRGGLLRAFLLANGSIKFRQVSFQGSYLDFYRVVLPISYNAKRQEWEMKEGQVVLRSADAPSIEMLEDVALRCEKLIKIPRKEGETVEDYIKRISATLLNANDRAELIEIMILNSDEELISDMLAPFAGSLAELFSKETVDSLDPSTDLERDEYLEYLRLTSKQTHWDQEAETLLMPDQKSRDFAAAQLEYRVPIGKCSVCPTRKEQAAGLDSSPAPRIEDRITIRTGDQDVKSS